MSTVESKDYAAIVRHRLEKSPEVRPFPAVVSRLLSACQNPDIMPVDIEQIIQCDPALAVSVLKIVNSAVYTMRTPVSSVEHAVAVLGVNKIRHAALAIAGSQMFANGTSAARERKAMWEHSLGCATVARLLASYIPAACPNDAFLAGIVHDVGKLLFYDVVPDKYQELLVSSHGSSLVNQEEFWFGISHEKIGLKSAELWNLPDSIRNAIGFHHDPSSAPSDFAMVALINIANQLSKIWQIGSTWDVCPDRVGAADGGIPIDEDVLEKVHEQAEESFQDALQAMAL